MKPKYKVYDEYEFQHDVLGYANTWEECVEIARERDADTDGECWVQAYPLNPTTQKYSRANVKTILIYE